MAASRSDSSSSSQGSRNVPEIGLPVEPLHRALKPFHRFLEIEAASGVLLLLVTIIALVLANGDSAEAFLNFWKTPVGLRIGGFEITHSLKHWINDGLMTLFFFVVGMEVKREIVHGELSDPRAAALPVVAALGGMVVPAGIYLSLQYGEPAARGWAIPMATDIAFVVGTLALLGRRIPSGLRMLLLSLAIVDDIGAILVIAFGYTSDLNLVALAWGFAGILSVAGLARLGLRSVAVYFVLGALIWFAFHESGVHATIAGVILGLQTPTRTWIPEDRLRTILSSFLERMSGEEPVPADSRQLKSVAIAANEAVSPLDRLEARLHPFVGFLIMPVFALANAGVPLTLSDFRDPIAIAVMAGLALGKPIGIVLFSWVAVQSGLTRLPANVTWGVLMGGAVLGGIGFTMALFIAGLGLSGDALNAAKVGILGASALCAVTGLTTLLLLTRKPADLPK